MQAGIAIPAGSAISETGAELDFIQDVVASSQLKWSAAVPPAVQGRQPGSS